MAMEEDFRRAALEYHRLPRPGKLQIEPTKRMATQRDLALAYSPGVAAPCLEIAANPELVPGANRLPVLKHDFQYLFASHLPALFIHRGRGIAAESQHVVDLSRTVLRGF